MGSIAKTSRFVAAALVVTLLLASSVQAAVRTSSQAGNWSSSSTWGGSAAPGNGDQAVIAHAVTVDTNTTVGTSPPTTPNTLLTTSASTGGSTTNLPTGSYRFRYSNVDSGGGESLTTESTNALSLTNGSSQPRVTFPALPTGVTSRNLYVTNTGGAAATEKLYATGITGTTYDVTSASWTNGTTTYAAAAAFPTPSAIQVNSGGSITGSNGVTLTVRGDIRLSNTVINMVSGFTLKLDASASVSPSNTPYAIWVGTAASHVSAGIVGTSGTLTSDSGGANGCVDVLAVPSAGVASQCGRANWSGATISRLGSSSRNAWTFTPSGSGYNWSLTNFTVDNCGQFRTSLSATNTNDIVLTDGTFTNPLNSSLDFYLTGAGTTGKREIKRVAFSRQPTLPMGGLDADYLFLPNGIAATSGTPVAMTNLCLWLGLGGASAINGQQAYGDWDDCYILGDANNFNYHMLQAMGSNTFSNLIFDGCPDSGGDNTDVFFINTGVTAELKDSIICWNHVASDGLGMINPSSAGVVRVNHCSGYVSLAFMGFEGSGTCDQFRSNIAYGAPSASNYFVKNLTVSPPGGTMNRLTSSGTTHNVGYDLDAGYMGGGYDTSNNDGTPGASDQFNVDPQWVDGQRNLRTWAIARGYTASTGTGESAIRTAYADGVTALRADFVTRFDDLRDYIRAGFVPTNEALRDAGHDGVTPGAVEMAAASGGAVQKILLQLSDARTKKPDPKFLHYGELTLAP